MGTGTALGANPWTNPFPNPRAVIGTYPGYDGNLNVGGEVEFSLDKDGAIKMVLNLNNLESNEKGGVHIHVGTSCETETDPGGHWWNDENERPDPWNDVKWESTDDKATNSHTVITGYGDEGNDALEQTIGKTVVVHDAAGTRIGCGTIHYPVNYIAQMSSYPGETNELAGVAAIKSNEDGDTKLYQIKAGLTGLEASAEGGFHVHKGRSCATRVEVEGHYFVTSGLNEDKWGEIKYTSDGNGTSNTIKDIVGPQFYHPVAPSLGRTIVTHYANSDRSGCGVIELPGFQHAEMSTYPEYEGDMMVTGNVWIEDARPDNVLIMTLDIEGLSEGEGGIHIHSGTSCETKEGPEGHYWKDGTDPWKTTPKWAADSSGKPTTRRVIITSSANADDQLYNFYESKGRTIVIHDKEGNRAACGVLKDGAPAQPTVAPVGAPSKSIGSTNVVSIFSTVTLTLAGVFFGLF